MNRQQRRAAAAANGWTNDGDEQAHRDLVRQQWDRITEIAPEALHTGGVVLVVDPMCSVLRQAGEVPLAPGVLAGVLPQELAEQTVRVAAGNSQRGDYIVAQLRAVPADHLRVLTIAGDGVALAAFRAVRMSRGGQA